MLRELYKEITPYNDGYLNVSDLHTVYFEESGNPEGKPVIFLHGGPGGGIEPVYRQYFDPTKWRIIIFDQRGCGKSTPHAELKENTTWDLVSDIEKLRKHLNISTWAVFGGSWGSTLSLSYAIAHPDRCESLTLRGIFLLRESEIRWFYQEGASHIFPDAWENYIKVIPEDERHDMVEAYYKRLTSSDENIRIPAAKAWAMWEAATSKLYQDQRYLHHFGDSKVAEAFSRIECHYFINKGFFESDGWILTQIDKIRHIPAVIIQGRYDVVCPATTAWALHRQWPEAELHIIPDSGHSMTEPGIRSKLIEITDRFSL
ncbi:MAG: prolyl aminopeptidase [Candidatus Marinimicrobia bacterium]|nr:prolyl aminopeptidase [Candidatus Neomarinimicrobiota bacterium]